MDDNRFPVGRYCISWYVAACSATGLGTAVWAFVNRGTITFKNLYYYVYGVFVWHVVCLAAFALPAFATVILMRRRGAGAPGQNSPAAYVVPGSLLVAGVFLYLYFTAGPLINGVARVPIALGFVVALFCGAVGLGFVARFLERRVRFAARWLLALSFAGPLLFIFASIVGADAPFYFRENPTVTLIVIDALRSDHVGVYGYGRNTTPRIDAFARAGCTVFSRAVAQAPWTSPSVASIFTSKLPSGHTVKSIWSALPDETETLAEVLREEGYATVCVSANPHVGRSMVQGFDYFYDLTYSTELDVVIKGFFGDVYEALFRGVLHFLDLGAPRSVEDADVATAAAMNALRKFRGRPVFLYVHYMDAHNPYDAPAPWDRAFGPPVKAEEPPVPGIRTVSGKLKDRNYVTPLTDDDIAEYLRRYDCEIRFCDHYVGVLLDQLEEERGGPRLAIITADHGEQFFDHPGYLVHGASVYREVLEVPLILSCSDIETDPRVEAPVALIDIMPTVLDWAGVPADDGGYARTDGVSLLRVARGAGGPVHEFIIAENNRDLPPSKWKEGVTREDHFEHKSIQNESYKLIIDYQWGVEELYDLAADPLETRNIIAEKPEVAAELRSALKAKIRKAEAEAAAPTGAELDEDHLKLLRDLGYVK